jgi:WD40 repeat protein
MALGIISSATTIVDVAIKGIKKLQGIQHEKLEVRCALEKSLNEYYSKYPDCGIYTELFNDLGYEERIRELFSREILTPSRVEEFIADIEINVRDCIDLSMYHERIGELFCIIVQNLYLTDEYEQKIEKYLHYEKTRGMANTIEGVVIPLLNEIEKNISGLAESENHIKNSFPKTICGDYIATGDSGLLLVKNKVPAEKHPQLYSTCIFPKEAEVLSNKIIAYYKKQAVTNPHLKTVIDLKSKFIDTRLIFKDTDKQSLELLQSNFRSDIVEGNPSLTNFLSLVSSGDTISTPAPTFWILGEAGTGKTYGLLHTWSQLIEKGKNAIYIPLNMLTNNVSIERYLERKIFTGEFTDKWREILSLEHKDSIAPMLLILDGFNEVDSLNQEQESVISQIEELVSDYNIIACVSSRRVDNLKFITVKNAVKTEIKPLDEPTIRAYIDVVCMTTQIQLTDNLLQLLRTPLMLALYCESSEYYTGDQHQLFPCVEYILGEPSESTIIWNYLQCMVSKSFETNIMSPEKRFSYIVLIRYIAPYMGYYMQSNNIFRLPITNTEETNLENKEKKVKLFDDLFDEAVAYYESIKEYSEVRNLRRHSNVMKEIVDSTVLRQIAINDLGLFVKNDFSIVLFHQSIRDCLSAIHYINNIKFNATGSFPVMWTKSDIKREIALIKHIAELDEKLEPHKPYKNINSLWKKLRYASPIYQKSESSVRENLEKQNHMDYETPTFSHYLISNCVSIYKYAYNSNFSKLDFSGIDLSRTPMNEFVFVNDDTIATFGDCAIGSDTFFIGGHSKEETIMSVVFRDNILLSRSDRSLRVWNTDTGKCVNVLLTTDAIDEEIPFLDVGFSNSALKCVYSEGKVIYEYDFESDINSIFKVCDNTILSVAYSPNSKMIVSTDIRNNVMLFDVVTKNLVENIQNDRYELYFKDNETLDMPYLHCDCSDDYVPYINNQDKRIHLIDIESKEDVPLPKTSYDDYVETICVRFSEKRKLCAVSINNEIIIYNLSDFSISFSEKYDSSLSDIAFSPCGEYFSFCSENKAIMIYNIEDILSNNNVNPNILEGAGAEFVGSFLSLAFQENTETLFAGDDFGKIHKLKKVSGAITTQYFCFDGLSPSVLDFDINKTETFVIGAYNDGTVKKWNLASGIFSSDYLTEGNYGVANCIRYSHKNDFIAVGFSNGNICFWNAETSEFMFQVNNTESVCSIAITEDDDYVICGCQSGLIHIWNIDKKKEMGNPVTEHTKRINALLICECQQLKRLVSVSDDGLALMWSLDLNSAEPLSLYKEIKKSDKTIGGITLFDDKINPAKLAILSDDGHLTEHSVDKCETLNDIELSIVRSTRMFGFENYICNNSSRAITYIADGKNVAISYSSYLEGSAGIQVVDIDNKVFSNPIPFYKYENYLDHILKLNYLVNSSSFIFCSIKGDIVVADSELFQPVFPPLMLDNGFSEKLNKCDLSQIIDINGITKHFVGNSDGFENIEIDSVDLENVFAAEAVKLLDGAILNPFNYVENDEDIDKWVRYVVNIHAKNNPMPTAQKHIVRFIKSLAQYLFHEAPPEEQNIYMMNELFRAAEVREGQKDFQSDLDRLFRLLEEKDSNASALKNYKKYKKLNPIAQKNVYSLCQRIFNPIIHSSNDILCHAKCFEDLPLISLSFISNSETITRPRKATAETEEQIVNLEIVLLTIIFTYMLTEIDMGNRTINKTICIIENIVSYLNKLQCKFPQHSAVVLFNDFIEDIDDVLLQRVTSSLIRRFNMLSAFYREFK